jgi:hypothetical protein
MKLKYIETCAHVYDKHHRIVRKNLTRLGYVINSEFSTYQNYSSASGMVGYWFIIHNRTGFAIALVKNRKDIKKVLDRFDLKIFDYAYTTDNGFLEWRSSEARYTMREQWQAMKDEGLIA